VSLVETGRAKPSADMIGRLAEQLRVPLRDRNQLLLAGGFAPPYAERALDDEAMAAVHDAIRRVLHAHEPYPAVVVDRRWDIVMTNRAFQPFLAQVDADLLQPPVNLVRLGVHPRGLARLVVNLADVRAVFRTRIARRLATAPDPVLTGLYEELLAPWADDDAVSPRIDADVVLPMVVRLGGRELRLFSTITTFGTPVDITVDEIAIESYYPADAESVAYFQQCHYADLRTGKTPLS
jgi:transcription regulator MmyB-like protein